MIEITGARVRLREFRPQEHERFIASRRSAGEGVAVTTFTEEELRAHAANSGRMTDRGCCSRSTSTDAPSARETTGRT